MTSRPITLDKLASDIAAIARRTLSVQTHIEPGCVNFTGTVVGIERMALAAAELVREATEQAEILPHAGFTFNTAPSGSIVVRWPTAPDGFQRTAIAIPGTELHRIAVETMKAES